MYSIPEWRVFRSDSSTLGQSILRAVHGEAVDVVLSLVDDDVAPQEWLWVGEFGRFIGLGSRGKVKSSSNCRQLADRISRLLSLQQSFHRLADECRLRQSRH